MNEDKNIPVPVRALSCFSAGEEVRHLGLAFRTDDCNFEVIDPENGRARSLMTGDDILMDDGYFIRLEEVRLLPETSDLSCAVRGDTYKSILDGSEYHVLSTDEHTVKLLETATGQVRLHSKIGSEVFYKLAREASGPPVDESGQFLLFEI